MHQVGLKDPRLVATTASHAPSLHLPCEPVELEGLQLVELLVQDPAAAPPCLWASVRPAETNWWSDVPARAGGLLRADQTPSLLLL